MRGSDFAVIELKAGVLFIRDMNLGNMSVTNDAERVLKECKKNFGKDIRVVYCDSEGEWAEIVWDHATEFTARFKPWQGLEWDILKR